MTYLEIVNNVLRRLREPEVLSVTNTEYSKLIATLVNDSKREIENAHTWNSLRTPIVVNTVSGVSSYTLVGSGTRFVFETTLDSNGQCLIKAPVSWIDKQLTIEPVQGTPSHFCFDGEASGDTKIKFFPIPSGVETFTFYLYVPQEDLVNNTDISAVSGYLIAQNTYARAIAERGEDSGNLSSEAYAMYLKALSDAIAIERNRYEEDINWEAT